MKFIKIVMGVFGVLMIGLTWANNFIAPSFKLNGIEVQHAAAHPNSASISLKLLRDYASGSMYWDIVCDYSTQEAPGAPTPSKSNPLSVLIDYMTSVISDNYIGGMGFVAPSGKLKMFVNTIQQSSIDFKNYDATGDLKVTNCVATLRIGSASK